MKEHNIIEVLTIEQAKDVAEKDQPSQSTKTSYVNENILTYYILINTWVLLWKNFAIHAWHRLLTRIMADGLIPVINECQEEAMRIIRGEDLGSWGRILYSEIRTGNPTIDESLITSVIGYDYDATVLMLLRYPKRFSPNSNDIIKDKTIKDFLQYENRTKLLQRQQSYGYNYAMRIVADVIREMYPWDVICDNIEHIHPTDIIFSSGAALDANPSPGSKWKAILTDGNHSDFIQPIFGVYTLTRYKAHDMAPTQSRVAAVPKSYKSSRIIAMERTYPNAIGKAIEMIFRDADIKYGTGINISDQTINQHLAQIGSSDGTIATLDASHASDLISKSLFKDLFPPRYVDLVKGYLPDYVEVAGKVRPLQMASTSGHTLTFRHETIIYHAIAKAAVLWTQALGIEVTNPVFHAFGDDTLVSTEAYDTALYLFQKLGLIINKDKSYAVGSYRESCGKDYINGVDVSSIYYPRFPVIGTITSTRIILAKDVFRDEYRGKLDNAVTMLIDLQKKLYPYTYDGSRLVASIVQTAYPSITTSVAGEVCNDLWDCIDSGKQYNPTRWALESTGKYISYPLTTRKLGLASESLSGVNATTFDRLRKLDTVHCYPTEKYHTDREFNQEEVEIYEYWKYYSFLKSGPRYHDPLMELLGIPSKPISIAEFFGKRTLALSRVR